MAGHEGRSVTLKRGFSHSANCRSDGEGARVRGAGAVLTGLMTDAVATEMWPHPGVRGIECAVVWPCWPSIASAVCRSGEAEPTEVPSEFADQGVGP